MWGFRGHPTSPTHLCMYAEVCTVVGGGNWGKIYVSNAIACIYHCLARRKDSKAIPVVIACYHQAFQLTWHIITLAVCYVQDIAPIPFFIPLWLSFCEHLLDVWYQLFSMVQIIYRYINQVKQVKVKFARRRAIGS